MNYTTKKIIMSLVLLFSIFILVACQEQTTEIKLYRVVLENGEDESLFQVSSGVSIDLPRLEKEGHLFVGWYDGENHYYDTYLVEDDQILTPTFELIEDVFEKIEYLDYSVTLGDYVGQAKHIVIPPMHNGYYVDQLATNTFKDTLIETIKIPNTVKFVGHSAFKDATSLRSVEFYGKRMGLWESRMPNDRVEELMADHGCTISFQGEPTEENPWVFPDECPIKEITYKSEPVILPGQDPMFSYTVLRDLSIDATNDVQRIYADAFDGATSLEKVHLPVNIIDISASTFESNIHLKEVTVDEDAQYYKVENDLLLTEDGERLIFYGPWLSSTSFTTPEGLKYINSYAFLNDRLQTINLSSEIELVSSSAFNYLDQLQAINVDENNSNYHSQDGVLFSKNLSQLVYYPKAKADLSYSLPEQVITVLDNAFYEQKFLQEINFNEGLVGIGHNAFYNAQAIDTYIFPSSISYIGVRALYTENQSVHTIVIKQTEEIVLGSSGLVNENDDLKIYVPDTLVDAYRMNQGWYLYEDFLTDLSEWNNE
jgi:hypothetical protein